jgi:hypothetical protein
VRGRSIPLMWATSLRPSPCGPQAHFQHPNARRESCGPAGWRISKVRLEQTQRMRREHEGARTSGGDQHGSNHRDIPVAPQTRPFQFCPLPILALDDAASKSPGWPCGPCHAMRQAQQGPNLRQERPSHATGWERG